MEKLVDVGLTRAIGLSNYNSKQITEIIQVSILPNFFLCKTWIFSFFAILLGHFKEQTIFYNATNTQAYQQKSEKRRNQSLVGLTPGLNLTKTNHTQTLIKKARPF
jgi:hypothetical protein